MSTRSLSALIALITLLGAVQTTKAQVSKEIEAIKAVITRETFSFMNVDRKAWSETWSHAPYAYWSYADSTGSSAVDGWEAINKTFDQYFKTQIPSTAKITAEWLHVKVYGDGAYARFIQKINDKIDVEVTSQVRVLEKKDGKWRVGAWGSLGNKPGNGDAKIVNHKSLIVYH